MLQSINQIKEFKKKNNIDPNCDINCNQSFNNTNEHTVLCVNNTQFDQQSTMYRQKLNVATYIAMWE